LLKSAGKVQDKLGIAIGLTHAELRALIGPRSMLIDLSDLGPEWAGRTLMLFAAENDATLAATLRQSAPDASITDQRRRILMP
jgi:hypothetical protein